jgi:hypothetical protein
MPWVGGKNDGVSHFRNLWGGIKFCAAMLGGALLFVDLSPAVFDHGPEEAARDFRQSWRW